MSTENEKAKKLKEIQDRLAEIQGKPVSKFSNTESEKKETEKKPIEKPIDKPVENEKKAEPRTPEKVIPQKVKDKSKLPIAELIKEGKKQEESSQKWSENKIKASEQEKNKANSGIGQKNKPEPKAVSRNRSNKLLSIISIIITLCVTTYIVYTYFLSGDDTNVIEAEVPIIQEKEETPVEEDAVPEEELAEGSVTEEEISESTISEESIESSSKRVNAKRTERKEQIAEKAENKTAPSISIAKSAVPGGFIISYSSNSNSTTAGKNVENLRSRGFDANYYYMRDKDPSGPDLYKVYLGPYSNESEAFPDFKKIIKINDKAFILNMK